MAELNRALISPVVSVSVVAQSGYYVLVLVEVAVHGSRQDPDLRVVLGHGSQTLRTTNKVEEEDVLCLHSVVLNMERLLLTPLRIFVGRLTFRTSRALMADPPVASIGSTRMTKLSLMFFGSFL